MRPNSTSLLRYGPNEPPRRDKPEHPWAPSDWQPLKCIINAIYSSLKGSNMQYFIKIELRLDFNDKFFVKCFIT